MYDERARAFVSAWKEGGRRDLASEAALLVAEVVHRPRVEAICFVPGEPDRTLARGHVSAAGLAAGLAERWGLALVPLLVRRAGGQRQRALPRAERRANVHRAFAAAARSPRHVLLVDDVYTTGSTATACATELRRAGALRVEVACLARVVA